MYFRLCDGLGVCAGGEATKFVNCTNNSQCAEWTQWTGFGCPSGCGNKREVFRRTCEGAGECPGSDEKTMQCISLSTCEYSHPDCAFPFEYRGVTYNDCIQYTDGLAWCSLDPKYNQRWTVCSVPILDEETHPCDFNVSICQNDGACIREDSDEDNNAPVSSKYSCNCTEDWTGDNCDVWIGPPLNPTDGDYTEWTMWSSCNTSCGGGFRERKRFCVEPYPSNGGYSCIQQNIGPAEDVDACNTDPCPIEEEVIYEFDTNKEDENEAITDYAHEQQATTESYATEDHKATTDEHTTVDHKATTDKQTTVDHKGTTDKYTTDTQGTTAGFASDTSKASYTTMEPAATADESTTVEYHTTTQGYATHHQDTTAADDIATVEQAASTDGYTATGKMASTEAFTTADFLTTAGADKTTERQTTKQSTSVVESSTKLNNEENAFSFDDESYVFEDDKDDGFWWSP